MDRPHLVAALLFALTACDEPSENPGTASNSETDDDTTPWSPGPGCPEVSWYQCSQAPEPDSTLLDADGCLPQPCSPDAEQTGCAEGEECVMLEVCTGLTGCEEVDGACMCQTDPTCSDYGCRIVE